MSEGGADQARMASQVNIVARIKSDNRLQHCTERFDAVYLLQLARKKL